MKNWKRKEQRIVCSVANRKQQKVREDINRKVRKRGKNIVLCVFLILLIYTTTTTPLDGCALLCDGL